MDFGERDGCILVTDFNPQGKGFAFRLNSYSCNMLKCGSCPLCLPQKEREILLDSERPYYRTYDPEYCVRLAHSLEMGWNSPPVEITRYPKCGHYSVTNGQHRLCIAAKIGLLIPVYVQEWHISSNSRLDGLCYDCAWKRKSLKYRVKSWFRKNQHVLFKL